MINLLFSSYTWDFATNLSLLVLSCVSLAKRLQTLEAFIGAVTYNTAQKGRAARKTRGFTDKVLSASAITFSNQDFNVGLRLLAFPRQRIGKLSSMRPTC
jgi:hypothetical protein